MSGTMTEKKPNENSQVSSLELLFDLVFAFAISQLSDLFLHHFTGLGAVETFVLMVPILLVWANTSWTATITRIHFSSTQRMLLVVMFLGLFMTSSITKAFADGAWAFVIPLLIIQFGRTLWTIANSTNEVLNKTMGLYRNHSFRVLIWLLLSAVLWILGAIATTEYRTFWWVVASGIDLLGTWLAHPLPGLWLASKKIKFDASHMQERCGLFLLIALGETVLTTGVAVAGISINLLSILCGSAALAGTIALWSLGFGRIDVLIKLRLANTRDPIRSSRYTVNILMVMVASLIAVAVANKKVIAHPCEATSLILSFLLVGGPICYLAAHAWYTTIELNTRPRIQLIGIAVLLALCLITCLIPAYFSLVLVSFTLVTLAILYEST